MVACPAQLCQPDCQRFWMERAVNEDCSRITKGAPRYALTATILQPATFKATFITQIVGFFLCLLAWFFNGQVSCLPSYILGAECEGRQQWALWGFAYTCRLRTAFSEITELKNLKMRPWDAHGHKYSPKIQNPSESANWGTKIDRNSAGAGLFLLLMPKYMKQPQMWSCSVSDCRTPLKTKQEFST